VVGEGGYTSPTKNQTNFSNQLLSSWLRPSRRLRPDRPGLQRHPG